MQSRFFVFLFASLSLSLVMRINMSDRKSPADFANNEAVTNCLNLRQMLFWRGRLGKWNATHVLLVTQMRSGSSLLSYLLTKSPSTFNTDEPAREFLGSDDVRKKELKNVVELLRDVLFCNFSVRPHYYSKRTSGVYLHHVDKIKLCFDGRMCLDPAFDKLSATSQEYDSSNWWHSTWVILFRYSETVN